MFLINELTKQLPALPSKVLCIFYAILGSVSSVIYISVIGVGEESMFLFYLKPDLLLPGKIYRGSGIHIYMSLKCPIKST